MTATVSPDFETAKALYLQGIPVPDIARQTCINLNTLRGRILRQGWSAVKAKARLGVTAIVKNSAQNALQASGERTRQLYATSAEKLALDLSQREIPAKLERANLLADTMSKGAKVAALVHGWENTTINAIVMAGDTTYAIESLCAEPIDVESVPSQPE